MLTHANVLCAADLGRSLTRPWIKNPSVVTAAGIHVDLTFFGRYPAANYFTDGVPLTARQLRRSTDGGLDHGANKGSAYRKWLQAATALSLTAGAAPATYYLLDYLLYYPLIPMEDVQTMDNTITLPRYTDGAGVQLMLLEQFPYVGGGTLRCTYTNAMGQSGVVSPTCTVNTQTALGTVATSAPATAGCPGMFVPWCGNCRGVKALESIEFLTADAGNLAAVLVKPLRMFGTYENTNPAEWDFLRDLGWLEEITDDAYLSLVCCPTGSLNGGIIDGSLATIWTET
jgi:hypothetical protein